MHLFAYLDPASGSLLIQAVIALIVGAGIYFRRFVVNPIAKVFRIVTFRRAPAPVTEENHG